MLWKTPLDEGYFYWKHGIAEIQMLKEETMDMIHARTSEKELPPCLLQLPVGGRAVVNPGSPEGAWR